jgi:hypothetical protein
VVSSIGGNGPFFPGTAWSSMPILVLLYYGIFKLTKLFKHKAG